MHANTVANVYIMSRHLQPYIPILKKITRMRDAKRRAYRKDCDRFSECAKNVLNNNVVVVVVVVVVVLAIGPSEVSLWNTPRLKNFDRDYKRIQRPSAVVAKA